MRSFPTFSDRALGIYILGIPCSAYGDGSPGTRFERVGRWKVAGLASTQNDAVTMERLGLFGSWFQVEKA